VERLRGERREALTRAVPFENEQRALGKDGKYRWFLIRYNPLLDEQGRIDRWYVAAFDIEDRKRAEEALQSNERNLNVMINTIPALIHTGRPDGYLDYFNRPWLEYLGCSLVDVEGWNWTAWIHPEDVKGIVAKWRACLATGEIFEYETRVRNANGEYRWMFHRKVPLRDAAGKILKWYGTSLDIEDRKRAEDALHARELDARSLLDNMPGLLLRLSPDGTPEFVNRPALQYVGKTLEEIRKWRTSDIVHPDDLAHAIQVFGNGISTGQPFDFEYRARRFDGVYRWFQARVVPVRNVKGQILHWNTLITDIDDRKRAEEARKLAEEALKDQLYKENLALRDEVERASMFDEIVGTSSLLKAVLSRIAKVAPTDSTVLITGETGTGKELIARAIHRKSRRAGRAFVSVNCAAIPRDLIPSELFGHEKGAFTGATQRRLGRFELADGGTIFLDEVGELLPDTQVALLRVLQERELERVGGGQPIHVDVRVITATNRDLEAAVANGTFRQDLFYRLNVFPIEMPPLRERKDDVLLLVEYFVQRYGVKAGKRIRSIDKKTLDLLQSYDWPGNIRELQNVIERSVILSSGDIFSVDALWLSKKSVSPAPPVKESSSSESQVAKGQVEALSEREIIEAALAATRGRVSGPSGAAAKLGIPASTLEARIRVLRINKLQFKFH
jgi:formate hydrogenlyase transcriptional activator